MGLIPTGLKALHDRWLAAFFTSEFAKVCTIVYPKVKQECPNCIANVVSQTSTGQYKEGGPQPFTSGGVCPLCQGRGKLEVETTDTATVLIHYNAQDFIKAGFNINIEEGSVMIEFQNSDKNKVLKADTIKFFPEHTGQNQIEYIRDGAILPKGLSKDSFSYCILKRKT